MFEEVSLVHFLALPKVAAPLGAGINTRGSTGTPVSIIAITTITITIAITITITITMTLLDHTGGEEKVLESTFFSFVFEGPKKATFVLQCAPIIIIIIIIIVVVIVVIIIITTTTTTTT